MQCDALHASTCLSRTLDAMPPASRQGAKLSMLTLLAPLLKSNSSYVMYHGTSAVTAKTESRLGLYASSLRDTSGYEVSATRSIDKARGYLAIAVVTA